MATRKGLFKYKRNKRIERNYRIFELIPPKSECFGTRFQLIDFVN